MSKTLWFEAKKIRCFKLDNHTVSNILQTRKYNLEKKTCFQRFYIIKVQQYKHFVEASLSCCLIIRYKVEISLTFSKKNAHYHKISNIHIKSIYVLKYRLRKITVVNILPSRRKKSLFYTSLRQN